MTRTPTARLFIRALRSARSVPPAARDTSSRRDFLQAAAAAGTALSWGAVTGCNARGGADRDKKVVVVGGGIAGLSAAYALHKNGIAATVYEAGPRIGGRIHSVSGAMGTSLTVELGGEFINRAHEDMLGLARDLELELFDRSAVQGPLPKDVVHCDGRRIGEAELAAALAPLAEQIDADATLLDEDWDAHAERFDTLSVQGYLELHKDKIPALWVYRLIETVMHSEYGRELDEQTALQLLWLLPTVEDDEVELLGESDETFSVAGGNSRIIAGIAARLGDQIQTGYRLTAVEQHEDGTYDLTFANGEMVSADFVIMAIPFQVLRKVSLNLELPEGLARFIGEVDLGVNGKLIAGYRRRAWQVENGFMENAWTDLDFQVAWDAGQGQEGEEGALTYFPGANRGFNASFLPPRELGENYSRLMEGVIPGIADEQSGKVIRKFWHNEPNIGGGYTNFRPGQYTGFAGDYLYIESGDEEEAQDVHVGNLVFAGEHLSDEFYGFMNGGAQTGRLAATVVVRLLEEALA